VPFPEESTPVSATTVGRRAMPRRLLAGVLAASAAVLPVSSAADASAAKARGKARTAAAVSVSFKSPTSGARVSGVRQGRSCEALARASAGVGRVEFTLDAQRLNTERSAPYNCYLDSRRFSEGRHVLKAAAYDRRGRVSRTSVTLIVDNVADPAPSPAPAPGPAPTSAPAPAPTSAPAPAPAPAPSPSARATTRPAGSTPLGDEAAAASVRRSPWEPRPQNAEENRVVPTADQLAAWRRAYEACGWGWSDVHGAHLARVTGNSTLANATTDELIQWTAFKWGIDEDIVRAVAVNESSWDMAMNGDDGHSWGITQVKYVSGSACSTHPGSLSLSRSSTAWNLDYWGAYVRTAFDGGTDWLGSGYRGGDIWGSIGAWYSGDWYSGSQGYVDAAKRHYAEKPWSRSGF